MKNLKKGIILLILFLFPCIAFGQEKLTYIDLVKKLYDLEALAIPPSEGKKTAAYTSYDRSSTYNPTTNSYEDWDANNDGEGYIRKEGDEMVVFESEGPGVIWRVWSALAKEGHIKIYLDHSEEPVIDRPFRGLFEQFDEDIPPMNFPNLVTTLHRGRNSYLPIPYEKHCKITLSKGWGAYYHIVYSKLPEKVQVPSFDGSFTKKEQIALAKADRFLSKRGYTRKKYENEKSEEIQVSVDPGQTLNLKNIEGNRAITELRLQLEDSSDADLLQDLWFDFSWDKKYPSAVSAPVGMFFGTGNDIHPYRTLPLGVIGNTLYSNWYMPFASRADLKVRNEGDETHNFSLSIVHTPLEESADSLLKFHAKWHNGLKRINKKNKKKGRGIDWALLKTDSQGRFCGITLHVKNIWEEPEEEADSWWYGKWDNKTIDWWWGEGDEKFFVDGEKFPSTYGTGSEDYVGYAWAAEPPFPTFDSPFAAQPHTPIDGKGHTIVNRFHIADNIPFQKSFEGVIEKYKEDKWGENNITKYDVVSYYYLREH